MRLSFFTHFCAQFSWFRASRKELRVLVFDVASRFISSRRMLMAFSRPAPLSPLSSGRATARTRRSTLATPSRIVISFIPIDPAPSNVQLAHLLHDEHPQEHHDHRTAQ